MKGIVFNLLEDVVTRHHGAATWDALLEAAEVDGAYTSLGSYPDADAFKLVGAASTALGIPAVEVLRWFGQQAMPILAERYPGFFRAHVTVRPFLLSLNSIIHPEVRKIYPGADVPVFDFQDAPDGALMMGYESARKLAPWPRASWKVLRAITARPSASSTSAACIKAIRNVSFAWRFGQAHRLLADFAKPPPSEVDNLRRRLDRERSARLEAERIAEVGLRQLYEQRENLQLLEAVAAAANRSKSLNEAFEFAITQVCRFKQWPVGHAYLRNRLDGAERLISAPIWHIESTQRMAEFRRVTDATSFEAGAGLPGRVWATGQPAWIKDVRDDLNFPRIEAASAAGLRAAFAFPVLVGDEVTAVIEFYSDRSVEPDEELLRLMSQVGTHLGRVVERKRAEDQLLHDASHDLLTGLPNRALFRDRLIRAIARRKRHADYHFAVLFVDLDRFKIVNDSLGHAAGDAMIVEVGTRLLHALRDGDMIAGAFTLPVRDENTLARLGGDEFIILIDELADPADSMIVATRMQDTLKQPFAIEGRDLYVTASIGIASSASGYGSADDIMRDADIAMYRAKTLGRARCEVYDEAMHAMALQRLGVESDLRRGLDNGEFVLHYQPIVALDTGRVAGFEALVRWQRSAAVLVYPGDFIHIAEDTGLIVPLGTWVMAEACRAMRKWRDKGLAGAGNTISVNVSARQFAQRNLIQLVRQAIDDAGIPASALCIEITESVTMGDAAHTVKVLSELKAIGVRLSIDDFGTGYSSLSYLHRFPLDVLKIDRSFISQMAPGGDGYEIVHTIMALARTLDMDVVAEGTETADQISRLQLLNCEYAQGYFFYKPVGFAAATGLLSAAPFPIIASTAPQR